MVSQNLSCFLRRPFLDIGNDDFAVIIFECFKYWQCTVHATFCLRICNEIFFFFIFLYVCCLIWFDWFANDAFCISTEMSVNVWKSRWTRICFVVHKMHCSRMRNVTDWNSDKSFLWQMNDLLQIIWIKMEVEIRNDDNLWMKKGARKIILKYKWSAFHLNGIDYQF